jgi:hypothetical protein
VRNLTRLLALALAALAFAAAGCGDDDDEGTDTGATGATGGASVTPLTEKEFVSQAEEICDDGTAALQEEGTPTSPDELEGYVTDTLVPNIQSQLDAIGALPPPEGQEDEVESFLDSAEEELDAIQSDPSSISEQSFQETEQLAEELGLAECGGTG